MSSYNLVMDEKEEKTGKAYNSPVDIEKQKFYDSFESSNYTSVQKDYKIDARICPKEYSKNTERNTFEPEEVVEIGENLIEDLKRFEKDLIVENSLGKIGEFDKIREKYNEIEKSDFQTVTGVHFYGGHVPDEFARINGRLRYKSQKNKAGAWMDSEEKEDVVYAFISLPKAVTKEYEQILEILDENNFELISLAINNKYIIPIDVSK